MFAVMTQFTPAAEEVFDTGRIMKIMEKQTERAVELVWDEFFDVVSKLAQLLCMIAYVLYIAIDYGIHDEELVFLLLLVPFFMVVIDYVIFIDCKDRVVSLNFQSFQSDDAWSSFVAERAAFRSMINNYSWGIPEQQEFETLHKSFNDKHFASALHTHFAQWRVNTVSAVMWAILLVAGGSLVLHGNLSTGAFVTLLNTTYQFGLVTSGVCQSYFALYKGSAAIQKIAQLFNAETRRMAIVDNNKRRKSLIEEYEHANPPPPSRGIERVFIYNMTFTHDPILGEKMEDGFGNELTDVPVNNDSTKVPEDPDLRATSSLC